MPVYEDVLQLFTCWLDVMMCRFLYFSLVLMSQSTIATTCLMALYPGQPV